MSVACPCCKAVNEHGPNCRRCKADLGLLFALEKQREMEIDEAKERALEAIIDGAFATALHEYQNHLAPVNDGGDAADTPALRR